MCVHIQHAQDMPEFRKEEDTEYQTWCFLDRISCKLDPYKTGRCSLLVTMTVRFVHEQKPRKVRYPT